MDWDDDGLKDLIIGEREGQVHYYRNVGSKGNPQLTYAGPLHCDGEVIDVGFHSLPWIDDWNDDGLKDLMVGSIDGYIYLFTNSGTSQNPSFNERTTLALESGISVRIAADSAPIIVDLNGDGVKDLVSGDTDGSILFFENVGTNTEPLLSEADTLNAGGIPINFGASSRVAAIDWNGDGNQDLIMGNANPRLRLFMQRSTTAPVR